MTEKEIEILTLSREGMTNKNISRILNICEKTVSNHMYNIFEKLEAKGRQEAIFKAYNLGYFGNF